MYKADLIHEQLTGRIGATAMLCCGAYLLFTLIDPFLYPGYALTFLCYRFIAIAYVLSLVLIRHHLSERHILPMVCISALIISLPTSLETFHTEGFASPYYVGLILIDVGGRLVYPVQAKRGLLISGIIFGPYMCLSFIHGDYVPSQAIQSIFHIAVSMIISAVGGELIYRLYIKQELAEKELRRLNEVLSEQILRDPLTNAFNRRYMQQTLDKEIALFRRYHTTFSLMICDLDNFKAINDIDGHQVGDAVLAGVCNAIGHEIRREDELIRFGGDEFALILPNTPSTGAVHLAKRVRTAVQDLDTETIGASQPLTISIGIAQIEADDTKRALLKRADLALYRAKRNGRDRFEVAS